MAFSCGFFNSKDGDRKYSAEQMSAIFDGVIQDGVFQSIGGKMFTVAGGGMNVKVQTGKAWFDHTWNVNNTDMVLPIDPADTSLTRVDAVVLEVNHTNAVRMNKIYVFKGTLSSNATKPDLSSNDPNITRHPLAYVTVTPGLTSITANNIQITVGTTECPFVTSVLEAATLDELFESWTNQFGDKVDEWDTDFNNWFNDVKAALEGNVVTNLQNQIDDLNRDKVAKADVATVEDVLAGTDNSKWVSPKSLEKGVGAVSADADGAAFPSKLVTKIDPSFIEAYSHVGWNAGSGLIKNPKTEIRPVVKVDTNSVYFLRTPDGSSTTYLRSGTNYTPVVNQYDIKTEKKTQRKSPYELTVNGYEGVSVAPHMVYYECGGKYNGGLYVITIGNIYSGSPSPIAIPYDDTEYVFLNTAQTGAINQGVSGSQLFLSSSTAITLTATYTNLIGAIFDPKTNIFYDIHELTEHCNATTNSPTLYGVGIRVSKDYLILSQYAERTNTYRGGFNIFDNTYNSYTGFESSRLILFSRKTGEYVKTIQLPLSSNNGKYYNELYDESGSPVADDYSYSYDSGFVATYDNVLIMMNDRTTTTDGLAARVDLDSKECKIFRSSLFHTLYPSNNKCWRFLNAIIDYTDKYILLAKKHYAFTGKDSAMTSAVCTLFVDSKAGDDASLNRIDLTANDNSNAFKNFKLNTNITSNSETFSQYYMLGSALVFYGENIIAIVNRAGNWEGLTAPGPNCLHVYNKADGKIMKISNYTVRIDNNMSAGSFDYSKINLAPLRLVVDSCGSSGRSSPCITPASALYYSYNDKILVIVGPYTAFDSIGSSTILILDIDACVLVVKKLINGDFAMRRGADNYSYNFFDIISVSGGNESIKSQIDILVNAYLTDKDSSLFT